MNAYLVEPPRPGLWRRTPKIIIAWFGSTSGDGGPTPPLALSDLHVPVGEDADEVTTVAFPAVEAPVGTPEVAPTFSDETWNSVWPGIFGDDLWSAISGLEDVAEIRSPFTQDPAELVRLVSRGESLDASYRGEIAGANLDHLSRYVALLIRPGVEAFSVLARVRRIGAAHAYIASGYEVPPPSKDYVFDTAVLPAPLPQYTADGLDFVKGTSSKPAAGQVEFADVEYDWNPAHQAFADLPTVDIRIPPTAGNAKPASALTDRRSHGTAMVGIVAGAGGTFRGVESPKNIVFSSVISLKFDPKNTSPVGGVYVGYAHAITSAMTELTKNAKPRGGVMLLELQSQRNGAGPLRPVEFEPDCWAVIELATANGITVIEPSGNSGINLGATFGGAKTPTTKGWPNDSGAIMVGAAEPHAPHARWGSSNYSHRVDCFGWRKGVVSSAVDDPQTDPAKKRDDTAYFLDCGGTSAASAMIAGAALAIQTTAVEQLGGQLPPALVRAILASQPRRSVYLAGDGRVGAMIRLGVVRSATTAAFKSIVREAWAETFGSEPPKSGNLVDEAWAAVGGPK